MPLKVTVVMDDIKTINPLKDTTSAMLLEAQKRKWRISYCEIKDLYFSENKPHAHTKSITVADDINNWYQLGKNKKEALGESDLILMRKDPPFDMNYLHATLLLEEAEKLGALVVNKPQALRNANEKLATLWFKDCCPPLLVTRKRKDILDFLNKHKKIVIKPLDKMGGSSIFLITEGDINTQVIIETVTEQENCHVMIQKYIPEITKGDKRILLIDGEPIPYALARIPKSGELRGNLARGASACALPLTERDLWICKQVSPVLKKMGLYFVGLDIIGDYLTEVNVTSPTCVRELNKLCNLNICKQLFDVLEQKLNAK